MAEIRVVAGSVLDGTVDNLATERRFQVRVASNSARLSRRHRNRPAVVVSNGSTHVRLKARRSAGDIASCFCGKAFEKLGMRLRAGTSTESNLGLTADTIYRHSPLRERSLNDAVIAGGDPGRRCVGRGRRRPVDQGGEAEQEKSHERCLEEARREALPGHG
jgi:hypothetical protein